ncbi:MAG: hypothetical protein JRI77_14145 [Deltaproteobacteria bacterium]|nr:hypothetical protein [Deltaproteobacteria bacterium]
MSAFAMSAMQHILKKVIDGLISRGLHGTVTVIVGGAPGQSKVRSRYECGRFRTGCRGLGESVHNIVAATIDRNEKKRITKDKHSSYGVWGHCGQSSK